MVIIVRRMDTQEIWLWYSGSEKFGEEMYFREFTDSYRGSLLVKDDGDRPYVLSDNEFEVLPIDSEERERVLFLKKLEL